MEFPAFQSVPIQDHLENCGIMEKELINPEELHSFAGEAPANKLQLKNKSRHNSGYLILHSVVLKEN